VSATHAREPARTGDGYAIHRDSLLAVIDNNIDGMLVIDHDGVILLANRAAEHLLGRPASGLRGTPFGAPLVLENATEIDVVAAGRGRTAEMRVVMIDWDGDRAFLASLRDVTDRKRAQAVLSRVGLQHAAIAMLGTAAVSGLPPDALMVQAAEHVRRVLAADFVAVFALSPEGRELRLVASQWSTAPPDPFTGPAEAGSQPRYTLEVGEPVVMDNASGEARFQAWPPGLASAATVKLSDHGQRFGVIEAASRSPRQFDRDELTFLQSVANLLAAALARSRVEGEVRHQALHDALTGLPNRALFLDRLTHALARARRQRTGLAVLFADLDGFKQVNDTLGHHAGDEVLVGVALRLTSVLRSSDSLARFGGDEFMMLLEDVESDEHLRSAVGRVHAAVRDTPFLVDGQPQALDLTIGLVRADESHGPPEDLIRDADAAMYRAKQLGRGGYAVFGREMREHAAERVRVEDELRAALGAGQLRLLYQPIVSLNDGRIVELEALLRWQHPERGLLEPSEFLHVAIESGLIVPIGKWTLRQACREAAAWRASSIDAMAPTVNVNMAPSELSQRELRKTVTDVIAQGGSPVRLQLELTESALIEDPSLAATLSDFESNLGVGTAIEDFGIGYSSLASLTRFAIDELKIDRSLIRTLANRHNAPIVAAIVSMAHALDILVVAEGIETNEQATEARRLGCDRGQGFFFARPLPPKPIAALLAQPTALPAHSSL
jgi:diguanylate cyclase (GGDEF)-like protein/PAS domain S-box-containing protein